MIQGRTGSAQFDSGSKKISVGFQHRSPLLSFSPCGRREERALLRLRPARRAVAHQAVEMHPDMGGFGRGIGERDGAVERDTSLVVAAKLHQERAAHPEEMKI